MKEVFEKLDKNRVVGFATVDMDGNPSNRNFQIAHLADEKIYFFTSNEKRVYTEMQKNPVVALTVTTKSSDMIRVKGRTEFVSDRELKREILELNPGIKAIYGSSENPVLELFRISSGEAEIFRLSQKPPTLSKFSY